MKISAVNESMSRAVCEHCLPRLPDVICRSESDIDRIWSDGALRSIFGRCQPSVWRGLSALAAVANAALVTRALRLGSGLLHSLIEEYKKMPLLTLVFVLIVVGVGLWLINSYIPMASSIKTILNVVVVVAVGVFVLKSAGLWGDVTSFRIGH